MVSGCLLPVLFVKYSNWNKHGYSDIRSSILLHFLIKLIKNWIVSNGVDEEYYFLREVYIFSTIYYF